MKILCVFGKYQYGDASRGIGTEYASFIPALERLGYEIIHFDSWAKDLYPTYAHLNESLLETVLREQPDVMLTVQRNYEIWLETLQIIRSNTNTATISWTTDDSWKYREVSRFIGTAYHAITTTYAECIDKYHKAGIPNVLLTQWAAKIDDLQPPLPASQCKYQVSFVGAAHGDRKQRIEALRKAGIEVTCFGHGWPSGSIPAEEIPEIIRESIISLNFSNAYKGVNQVKARTYEVPGSGGFLLTEYAPNIERAYIPEEEIAIFHSHKDLVEKIQYFLSHLDERDRIAQAGFLRTKEQHTYDIRMHEVIEFALKSHQHHMIENFPTKILSNFAKLRNKHQITFPLKYLRLHMLFLCTLVWGNQRGPSAARRIMFEVSWRFLGVHTFTAAGLVGRMFPNYSDSGG
jgi:spore maturation protein CgeB